MCSCSYNLDVVDNLEPVCTLGGQQQLTAEPSIKKKTKKKQVPPRSSVPSLHRDLPLLDCPVQPRAPLRTGSHQDAVIGLSWNALHRSVLASASADGTVKAWDLATGACMHTFTHHAEKVQTVRWHPSEGTVYLPCDNAHLGCARDGSADGCYGRHCQRLRRAHANGRTQLAVARRGREPGVEPGQPTVLLRKPSLMRELLKSNLVCLCDFCRPALRVAKSPV
jgi:hypothetical protein